MPSYCSPGAIPSGLSQPARGVYQKLIAVAKQRNGPRPIVVITDVGKDYDDLAALLVLKELHRLRLVELRAVVANLMPADKRANLAKAALESLDLGDVPVACGTRGSPGKHEVLDHEFNQAEFVSRGNLKPLGDGQRLLLKVYRNAKKEGTKLYLLCLSSLQDIHEFASKHGQLVANHTAEVHMQGGNYISEEGNLEPDCNAANNRFNLEAARGWHSFIQAEALPSHTYTKVAAFAAPLASDVFVELEHTGHSIGKYLRRVQVQQDLTFYEQACESDPEKRFAPFMDQTWFLTNKTNWYQRAHAEGDALPTGTEVIPYLTKLVVYDAQAALGLAGQDAVAALKVFQSPSWDRKIQPKKSSGGSVTVQTCHRIIGDERSPAVFPAEISLALSTLMKGSLLIVQESSSGGSAPPRPLAWSTVLFAVAGIIFTLPLPVVALVVPACVCLCLWLGVLCV